MANHKSAAKRNRQSHAARERNRATKATMRTAVKKARAEITEKKATPSTGDVQAAVKLLASAGKKRVLHKRTAARRISRLMKAAAKAAKKS